jgi:hypothetical protein
MGVPCIVYTWFPQLLVHSHARCIDDGLFSYLQSFLPCALHCHMARRQILVKGSSTQHNYSTFQARLLSFQCFDSYRWCSDDETGICEQDEVIFMFFHQEFVEKSFGHRVHSCLCDSATPTRRFRFSVQLRVAGPHGFVSLFVHLPLRDLDTRRPSLNRLR